jgi:hypothetical protein
VKARPSITPDGGEEREAYSELIEKRSTAIG